MEQLRAQSIQPDYLTRWTTLYAVVHLTICYITKSYIFKPHKLLYTDRSMSMSPSRARPAAPDVGPVRQLIRESFQSAEPQGGRNGFGFGRGSRMGGQQAPQPMGGLTRLR